MALDIRNIMYDMEWGFTYIPQSYWVRGAEYIKEREAAWMLTTQIDTFIDTFKTKGMTKPTQHHNSQDIFGLQRSKLSPIAMKAIEDAYACDYAMMRGLGVPESSFTQYNGTLNKDGTNG